MRASRDRSSWLRWMAAVILLALFTAVIVGRDLAGRRSAPGFDAVVLALAWGATALRFVRWIRARSSTAASGALTAPPRIALPPELENPPPRRTDDASRLVRSAVARYRANYLGATLLVAAPLWNWHVSGDARGSIIIAVPCAVLGLGLALFVESNVRAVRRLVREGVVLTGVVRRLVHHRGGASVTVEFALKGRPLRAAALAGDVEAVDAGLELPVLAVEGWSLVGVVTSRGEIAVGRARPRRAERPGQGPP